MQNFNREVFCHVVSPTKKEFPVDTWKTEIRHEKTKFDMTWFFLCFFNSLYYLCSSLKNIFK